MKSYKEYRFESNPKEKEIHDLFKEMFSDEDHAKTVLSAIVFGWKNGNQSVPERYLTDDEEDICLGLIQWLGSSSGQYFLLRCGFRLIK